MTTENEKKKKTYAQGGIETNEERLERLARAIAFPNTEQNVPHVVDELRDVLTTIDMERAEAKAAEAEPAKVAS